MRPSVRQKERKIQIKAFPATFSFWLKSFHCALSHDKQEPLQRNRTTVRELGIGGKAHKFLLASLHTRLKPTTCPKFDMFLAHSGPSVETCGCVFSDRSQLQFPSPPSYYWNLLSAAVACGSSGFQSKLYIPLAFGLPLSMELSDLLGNFTCTESECNFNSKISPLDNVRGQWIALDSQG